MHVVELPEVYEAEDRMSLLGRIGRCEPSLRWYDSDAGMRLRRLLVNSSSNEEKWCWGRSIHTR